VAIEHLAAHGRNGRDHFIPSAEFSTSSSDRRAGAHSPSVSHSTDPDLPAGGPVVTGRRGGGAPGFTVTIARRSAHRLYMYVLVRPVAPRFDAGDPSCPGRSRRGEGAVAVLRPPPVVPGDPPVTRGRRGERCRRQRHCSRSPRGSRSRPPTP